MSTPLAKAPRSTQRRLLHCAPPSCSARSPPSPIAIFQCSGSGHLRRRWDLDAELAQTGSSSTSQIHVLPRARRLLRPAAHPALYGDWRRHCQSARSPAAPPRLPVSADGDGVHARRPGVHASRPHIANHHAVVHRRLRAGVRRPCLPVTRYLARAQEGPAERDRAQMMQFNLARVSGRSCHDDGGLWRRGRLRPQRPVVSRRDRRARVPFQRFFRGRRTMEKRCWKK